MQKILFEVGSNSYDLISDFYFHMREKVYGGSSSGSNNTKSRSNISKMGEGESEII